MTLVPIVLRHTVKGADIYRAGPRQVLNVWWLSQEPRWHNSTLDLPCLPPVSDSSAVEIGLTALTLPHLLRAYIILNPLLLFFFTHELFLNYLLTH